MAIEFKSPTVAKNTITDRLEKQGREAKLQEKSVNYTENNDYQVLPDEGFDGMSKVNVSVDVAVPTIQNSKTVNITANGTQTILPDANYDAVEQVVVNTNVQPRLQEKTVDVLLTETSTNIQPDSGFDGMSSVTVNHPPVESNTAYTATSNGSYTIHPSEGFDATTSVNLTVNVTNPPTAYDIRSNCVAFSGADITQSDINSVTGWDTVTNLSNKFYKSTIKGNGVEFPQDAFKEVTDLSYTFTNIRPEYNLDGLNFSKCNFNKVVKAKNFIFNGNYDYTSIMYKTIVSDLPQTGFPNLTDATSMFYYVRFINPVPYRAFENVSNFSNFMDHCEASLNSISLYIPKAENMKYMFYFSNFAVISLMGDGTTTPTNFDSCFSWCRQLQTLSFNDINIAQNLNLSDSPSLTQDSVNNVLNALADGVTDKEIIFAATQYGYITEEQKAAATAKGWTIKSA